MATVNNLTEEQVLKLANELEGKGTRLRRALRKARATIDDCQESGVGLTAAEKRALKARVLEIAEEVVTPDTILAAAHHRRARGDARGDP